MLDLDEITKNYNVNMFFERVKKLVKLQDCKSLSNFLHDNDINLYSYYSLQKQGNYPRADVALKIANALDVSLDFLITGKDRKTGVSQETLEEINFPYGDDVKKLLDELFALEPDQRDMLLFTLSGQINYFQERNTKK